MAGMTLQEIMAAQLPQSDMGGPVSVPQGAPQKAKLNWGAILADALSGLAGQQGQHPQRVAREQRDQQEQAQWHQRRQADLEDYGRKLEMQNDPRYAKPESRYWEDNAGNQWKMGANGQPERFFTDMAPKQYIQDGMLITAPNPYNTGPAAVPPPATITPDLWESGTPLGGQTPASGGFPRFR